MDRTRAARLSRRAAPVFAAAALCGTVVAGAAASGVWGRRGASVRDGRAELQDHGALAGETTGERLEREVRAKLVSDPALSGGGSIVVIVDGSRVVLEGWVASQNERTLAEADAATVEGVSGVDDRLLVRQ